jgi:alpha 1,2-mannosyltransferase
VSAEIGLRDVVHIRLCSRRVSVLTASTVEFGVIPKAHWNQPDWIDEEKASSARHRMDAANVKYGGAYYLSFLDP